MGIEQPRPDERYADPRSKHIIALRDATIKVYDDLYSSPRNQKIKGIAIALYSKRHLDPDPYLLTVGGTDICEPCKVGKGGIVVMYPMQPAWVTFVVEAENALKAIEEAEQHDR